MTASAPATADEHGATVPDLTGLDGYLSATLDPGGETYTVTMPDGWRPPGVLESREFLRRLTPAERIAGRALADPIIEDFERLIQMGPTVNLADPDTLAGVQYLVSVGVLTEARAAEVLSTDAE